MSIKTTGHHLRKLYLNCLAVCASGIVVGCSNIVASPGPTSQLATPFPSATPAPKLPWWNDRIFYEIFVRSYYDSNGDGIGDLNRITQKLDYLNDGNPETTTDLGITGIWLMPVAEAASYHGYDVVDYKQVESDYGTNEDFRRLMSEAHKRGIVVIVDLVLNHTSSKHPWFNESQSSGSPYADWYVWADQNPGYSGPWGEQVWHEMNSQFYYGMFTAEMPDLNYQNSTVTSAMEDVASFWLEDMGADGFRLDAVRLLIEDGEKQENTNQTHEWFKSFHSFVKTENPDSLIVGEIWSPSVIVSQYEADEIDLGFEFDLAAELVRAPDQGDGRYLAYVQKQSLDLFPAGQYGAFLTNHDQNRVMTNPGGDVNKAKVATALLLTNPGVPFIYYGEEIGMTGEKPDEHIRRPMQWTGEQETAGFTTAMPWEPLADNISTSNIEVELADENSLLRFYQTLIHLRERHSALRSGEMLLVESSASAIYAYLRHDATETLLVLINLSDATLDNYSITLKQGLLTPVSSAKVLLGTSDITIPFLNQFGGFDEYTPIDPLQPHSTLIIALQP